MGSKWAAQVQSLCYEPKTHAIFVHLIFSLMLGLLIVFHVDEVRDAKFCPRLLIILPGRGIYRDVSFFIVYISLNVCHVSARVSASVCVCLISVILTVFVYALVWSNTSYHYSFHTACGVVSQAHWVE